MSRKMKLALLTATLASASAFVPQTAPKFGTSLNVKQDFLEYSPYYDHSAVKVNTFKNKAPFTGKVVSTKRIVGPKATGETCHIIIDHEGDFPYIEGQSWGVIPPGNREKDGKPHAVRLYSIASSRYGDDMTGATGSLCVRRATYWCPELQADDPAKKGICSNFLCDTGPGDEVKMTGPSGKVMLMPEEDPTTDYIMVATGTGIAPFRGFVRRLFMEETPAADVYKGQAWLFLGVANSDALLYDDEFQDAKARFPENFRLDYALSREQENKKGGKMYIQDKVEEYADEIFGKLEGGAHMYFCGLKGMMPGIQDMLAGVCESKGIDYDEWIKGLKRAWGKLDVVKGLLDADVDPNSVDPDDDPVLFTASMKGNTDVVRALLAARADVKATNDVGYTALMLAVRGGRVETVKELLAAGADKEVRNMQGDTALEMGRKEKQEACVSLLE